MLKAPQGIRISLLLMFLVSAAGPAFAEKGSLSIETQKGLLKAICNNPADIQVVTAPEKRREMELEPEDSVMCSQCPDFTGFAEGGGGSSLSHLSRLGHFTSATANEAMAFLYGCESARIWRYQLGDLALLRRQDRGWTRISTTAVTQVEQCRDFQSDTGRTVLVCAMWDFDEMGNQQSVDLFSAHDSKIEKESLIPMFDSAQRANPETPCEVTKIKEIDKMDFPAQHGNGFRTVIRRSKMKLKGAPEPSYLYKCDEFETEIEGKDYNIDFIWDGKTFQPTAESQRTLQELHIAE
jgi:hypothetical protein